MAAAGASPPPSKADKKQHKRDKKRAREEEDAQPDVGRKLKKPKSIPAGLGRDDAGAGQDTKKERKHKRDKERKVRVDETAEAAETAEDGDAAASQVPAANPDEGAVKTEERKKKKRDKEKPADQDADAEAAQGTLIDSTPSKKHKKKNAAATEDADAGPVADESSQRSKKSKREKSRSKKDKKDAASLPQPVVAGDDAMDVDCAEPASASVYQPPDMPANPQFPFFSQTVSLYEPLYPTGWAAPVTNAKYQHLQHLQNRYVPALRGVLLDYANVTLGPTPGRGPDSASDDDTPTTVASRGEYAVGFGWITADVDVFVPSRGAWMEGSVNLQTEGHIGVVCFGRFNASIEARRLPPAWTWVSSESADAQAFDEAASAVTADDHGVVRQIHSTGFWVDGAGVRVKGKTRFRIRNFDAGTSGDASYLSLEGTMLDMDAEKRLVKEEALAAQARQPTKGDRGAVRHRAPDFSMTRFADQEADGAADGSGWAGDAAEPEPGAPGSGSEVQAQADEENEGVEEAAEEEAAEEEAAEEDAAEEDAAEEAAEEEASGED